MVQKLCVCVCVLLTLRLSTARLFGPSAVLAVQGGSVAAMGSNAAAAAAAGAQAAAAVEAAPPVAGSEAFLVRAEWRQPAGFWLKPGFPSPRTLNPGFCLAVFLLWQRFLARCCMTTAMTVVAGLSVSDMPCQSYRAHSQTDLASALVPTLFLHCSHHVPTRSHTVPTPVFTRFPLLFSHCLSTNPTAPAGAWRTVAHPVCHAMPFAHSHLYLPSASAHVFPHSFNAQPHSVSWSVACSGPPRAPSFGSSRPAVPPCLLM